MMVIMILICRMAMKQRKSWNMLKERCNWLKVTRRRAQEAEVEEKASESATSIRLSLNLVSKAMTELQTPRKAYWKCMTQYQPDLKRSIL